MIIRCHDALVYAKEKLGELEKKYGLSSEEFYVGYMQGRTMVEDNWDRNYWVSLYEMMLRVISSSYSRGSGCQAKGDRVAAGSAY